MDPSRLFQRAVERHRAGDTATAEALYRKIVKRDSQHDQAAFLLAALELEAGRTSEAINLLKVAIRRVPNHPAYHSNLGEAYRRENRLELALVSLDKALALNADLAEVHLNRGLTLEALDRFPEALEAFERAVSLKPGLRGAWYRLAHTASELGAIDRALELYRDALVRFPDAPELHHGLGVALKDTGRVDLAVPEYRRAIELAPGAAGFHSSLVYTLSFHPGYSDREILAEARRWSERHAGDIRALPPSRDEDPDPERPLRVGFIGPTFSDHIIGRLLEPLFTHRDRERYELYCYSDVRFPDHRTERLRALSDVFRTVNGVEDAAVADLVRNDHVDILIDVNMHMGDSRLRVFAHRPARIQACWIAYPGTTGLSGMDYRISDRYLDPEGTDPDYSERTLRLPHTFWCYDPHTAEPPEVGPLPMLAAGYPTFGFLNNFCKLNAGVLRVWARILGELPTARLLVLSHAQAGRSWLTQGLSELGVDPERVEFVGFQPRPAYLATYRRVDLGLDSFPYNGHTTSLDSFWMGVPVVTLCGSTVASRAGHCLLENLDLAELSAKNEDEYVRIALELARDSARLSELRTGLRARMEGSPLMDAPRFARDFEELLRGIWRRHLAPESIRQNLPRSAAP